MRTSFLGIALALAATSAQLAAQPRYVAPWDPQTEAAAEAATAGLGANRPLAIRTSSSVLSIPALAGNVGGTATSVAGTVQSVKQALSELRAVETALEVQVELPADVLFDFDKAAIRPEAVPALDKVMVILRAYAKSQVLIEGHTDAKGTAAYNQALSERRAASVRAWLEGRGATDVHFRNRGMGATQPVARETNPDGSDSPEGRQKNRRVRIVITKAS